MSGALSGAATGAAAGSFITPGIGTAIGGVAGLIGGLFSNATNAKNVASTNAANMAMQQQAEDYNSQQAAIDRDFQDWQTRSAENYNTERQDAAMAYDTDSQLRQYQDNSKLMAQQQDYNLADAIEQQQFAAAQQSNQQSYEAAQAQIQRDWQTAMSGTAYQRSVADMKAAGLNPILGVASGGASTPSGAMPSTGMAQGSAASVGGSSVGAPSSPGASISAPGGASARIAQSTLQAAQFKDVIGPAISSAMDIYRGMTDAQVAQAQVANMSADTANKALTGENIQSLTRKNITDSILNEAQAATQTSTQRKLAADTDLAQSQMPVAGSVVQANLANAQAATAAATTSAAQAEKIRKEINLMVQQPGVTVPGLVSAAAPSLNDASRGASASGAAIHDWLVNNVPGLFGLGSTPGPMVPGGYYGQ